MGSRSTRSGLGDEGDRWQLTYVPVPTDMCDLCADRVGKGKKPACVHSCYTGCMKYGTVESFQPSWRRRASRSSLSPSRGLREAGGGPRLQGIGGGAARKRACLS